MELLKLPQFLLFWVTLIRPALFSAMGIRFASKAYIGGMKHDLELMTLNQVLLNTYDPSESSLTQPSYNSVQKNIHPANPLALRSLRLKRRQFLFLTAGINTWAFTALASQSAKAPTKKTDICSPSTARSQGIRHESELRATKLVRLQPGEMVVVQTVNPRCYYYPTQVIIEPGAVYQFDSVGFWKDGWLPCGPEGWPGLLLQAGNRLPGRQFFLLCGAVGKNEKTLFPIGRSREWKAPEGSKSENNQLYLFANDWPQAFFQSNNRELDQVHGGPIRVTIFRVS